MNLRTVWVPLWYPNLCCKCEIKAFKRHISHVSINLGKILQYFEVWCFAWVLTNLNQ
eukprot:UN16922